MIAVESSGKIEGWTAFFRSKFIESVGAKTIASASFRFIEYLKNSRYGELFEHGTGKATLKGGGARTRTRDTIGTYRLGKSKTPAYVVKAGAGIPGNLNYLAGLYRGQATSKSGKVFSYSRKRDLITEGWKAWGGEEKLEACGEKMLEKMIADAEAKL